MQHSCKKLGIYVHVPFCKGGKCPYCDFYSVIPSDEKQKEYISAVLRDIKKKSFEAKDRTVDTIYFGGGTPSVLGVNLARLLDGVTANFNVEENAEITFEANPRTVCFETLRALRKAGFNRISIGMQSAVPAELEMLGRRHSREDVAKVVNEARRAGFTNLSLDLMLCVPGQTEKSLLESIDYVAALEPEHVSAYLLKVEEGTRFYKIKDTLDLPDEDAEADMYLLACNALEERGYMQYEISNFAKPGFESRHNTRYWNCDEYLGFGPSAHSFYEGKRFYYPRVLEDYIKGETELSESDGGSLEEYIMLRLRLKDGLHESELCRRYDTDFSFFNKEKLERFIKAGFIEKSTGKFNLTKKGFLVSNSVIAELIFD